MEIIGPTNIESAAADAASSLAAISRGSGWITEQIRHAIREGRYAHGEKLPAERQFASAFGASRATVRTALCRLETERLVTRRIGAGTFVNFRPQNESEKIAELTSPVELIDVRIGLEPNMVRLAVLNATGRDIDRLAEIIARMEASSRDRESFTLWDEEFHESIAEATRNPLMVSIYRQINEVRMHSQWSSMKDKILTPEHIAAYNDQHLAIYEAIRSRDVAGAVAIVTDHLHYARRHLVGADRAGPI
jgi:DNA-binding FadR family transcriptional regulator